MYTRKRKKNSEIDCAVEKESFKAERRTLSAEILSAKEENWASICDLVDSDPWGLPYKIVMRILISKRAIPGLNLPGRLENIVDTLFPDRPAITANPLPVTQEDLDQASFSPSDVLAAASKLPNGKAPGPDGIPNEVLKVAVSMHPGHFATVFNACVSCSFYPPQWKTANLVLIRKPGKPLDNPSAYRPLCMLDSTGKLFEKLLTGRLRDHLRTNGRVTGNQYGFRKGKSTLDAMTRINNIVKKANGRGQARNKFVGMVTLDVKNAFNSAPWDKILGALVRYETPPYLTNMLGEYLHNRSVTAKRPDGTAVQRVMSCGYPQGSVLGPDLWNILYDQLLEISLPPDMEIIAFADDVALVATAEVPFLLEERLEVALRTVVSWMERNGLELALEKTEAVLFTKRNVHNSMRITYDEYEFSSLKSIKYLGVQLDTRQRFADHAQLAAKRASDACRQLSQILPNLRGPRHRTRRILATVVTSRLLYGAPIWHPTITVQARKVMESVHRRVMLRVACCYRTVSHEAAAVVSSMPPLKLMAEERTKVYNGIDKFLAKAQLASAWQASWTAAENGRWTFRLISNLGPWIERKHGEVCFHLSQVLTGHGCFNHYLKRFGKSPTDECGTSPDTAEHAVFNCDAWFNWRREACTYLGVNQLTPENMVGVMLESHDSWRRVASLLRRIMTTREKEERRRQHAARELAR